MKRNAKAGQWDFIKTVASQYGLHVGRSSPGDGKTRFSFYKLDPETGQTQKHLYTAVGIREATTWIEAFRAGKENPSKRNAGTGKAFTFHGSYTSKILARRKEKETPGSFIEEKDGRYYVLKPKKIRTIPTRQVNAKISIVVTPKDGSGPAYYSVPPTWSSSEITQWLRGIYGRKKFTWKYFFEHYKAKSNPKGTLIYGQVDCIYATKKQNHICDDECKAHGHRYYHKFSSKPKMYGLPDGSLLIKS